MKKYTVQFIETIQYETIEVEASSEAEAREKAEEKLGEIDVLETNTEAEIYEVEVEKLNKYTFNDYMEDVFNPMRR